MLRRAVTEAIAFSTMWALRRTTNLLRVHGKYHHAFKASAGRLQNWKDSATHSTFTCQSVKDDVVGLGEKVGPATGRGISHFHYQYPKFAKVGRGFTSQVETEDKDSAVASEDEFSELEHPDNSAEAHIDPYLSEAEGEKEQVHNATPLYQAILSCQYFDLPASLDQWLADGNVLTRREVAITFVHLRKRSMYRRLLKVSDWLEVKKPYKMNERDYASRLDVVTRVLGIVKADKYFASIPLDMRGQRVYGTLLTNYSSSGNAQKAEEIFKKMKAEGFPLNAFEYNQLLMLYKRLDKRKIQDVLKMMEDEGVKPNIFTYKILIDAKGFSGDIRGMEQVVENMKSEDIEMDSFTLELLARHYIRAGLAEKAELVLKELENVSLTDKRSRLKMLLPLYADLGKHNEVERIWKDFEAFPNLRSDEYVTGVAAWGKLGQLEKAEMTFEILLNSGKKLSAKHYSALLNVYADQHLLLKGKELVKRMSNNGCAMEPHTWDALIRLHVNAGELEKADSILLKACNQRQLRPKYWTMATILEKYAERGDVANAEKIFDRMRQVGYTSSGGAFVSLLKSYVKARVPAYGIRERMKADKIDLNGRLNHLLQQVDAFKNDNSLEGILD